MINYNELCKVLDVDEGFNQLIYFNRKEGCFNEELL